MSRGSALVPKGKKKGVTFTVDYTKLVEDKIMVKALQNTRVLGCVFKNAATNGVKPCFLKTRLKLFI